MSHIQLGDENISIANDVQRFRRLVTGVDDQGRSIFVEDTFAKGQVVAQTPTFVNTNLWRHESVPVDNRAPVDDGLGAEVPLAPPAGGSVFRVVEFPPDSDLRVPPSTMMHATPSLDYAIVLTGTVWAVLDADERELRAGDILIQRGTAHAWSNRSNEAAVVAFVLIGGNAA